METLFFITQLLNIEGLEVSNADLQDDQILLYCHSRHKHANCPVCGQKTMATNQYTQRKVRDLPILERKTFLLLKVRQFHCKDCHRYFSETYDFVTGNHEFTIRQERFICELAAKQSYARVAAIIDTSAKTIERIYLAKARADLKNGERFKDVKRMGIDEQSHRKGKQNYIAIITNLDTGAVIEMLPDRKKDTLIAFFRGLGTKFCQDIIVFSCDIWKPFIGVCLECFPNATIVLDHFHVVKQLNIGLDKYRRALRKEFPKEEAFKNLKWLLFRRWASLNEAEQLVLLSAFKVSPLLKVLYEHREEFHAILSNSKTKEEAILSLDEWVKVVKNSGLTVFNSFAKLLTTWKDYITNYISTGLTNAVTEGLNNLIRFIRRISFGMPSFKNLRLRVLALEFI